MSLKTKIIEWLDIRGHARDEIVQYINNNRIGLRKEIGEALADVLDGKDDSSFFDCWRSIPNKFDNVLDSKINAQMKAIRDETKTIAKRTMLNSLQKEKVIDDIVERIQRKQLR